MPLTSLTFPTRAEFDENHSPKSYLSHADFSPLWKGNFERYRHAFRHVPQPLEIDFGLSHKFDYEECTGQAGIIKVTIGNNVTAGVVIPFTPWILAHRMGHCIQANDSKQNKFSCETAVLAPYADLVRETLDLEVDHVDTLGGDRYRHRTATSRDNTIQAVEVAPSFLTTRAARNGDITNPLDIFAELLAQYIICGSAKLRAPLVDKPLPLLRQGRVRESDIMPRPIDGRRLRQLNQRLNKELAQQLDKLVGFHLKF